jgi:hypothetical protein
MPSAKIQTSSHTPRAATTPAETPISLPVPYFCQRDSATAEGLRMCFSSTCSMASEYLRPGCLAGTGLPDDRYLRIVRQFGDATEAHAQWAQLGSESPAHVYNGRDAHPAMFHILAREEKLNRNLALKNARKSCARVARLVAISSLSLVHLKAFGESRRSEIVNGELAGTKAPQVVRIEFIDRRTNAYNSCSAIRIGQRHFLTAGHCYQHMDLTAGEDKLYTKFSLQFYHGPQSGSVGGYPLNLRNTNSHPNFDLADNGI